ncbi:AGE family epimerase/isomerase [Amnibacterium sp. CER49]|uniref:AGE family epimerase/isomerase n=1 Tax=Amnibacterium sp. CER49 TaxID=3039161 RepID=UPI00244B6795|nr:AGE family epimerase/isomerase [Amnibacterium sp. CER49]MDH2444906.1 AGE family epimerase/isomerase [Amnibacterium sp. CER49]
MDVNNVAWCAQEEQRLLAFPRALVRPDGDAVVLDFDGSDTGRSAPTYLTGRTAHVAALAGYRGSPTAARDAHRLRLRLIEQGPHGWTDDPPVGEAPWSLYALSFVILAAATGTGSGSPEASTLLQLALNRLENDFWDTDRGLPVDRVRRDGSQTDYRGLNGAMHLTEALFAAWAATGDDRYRDRAIGMCRFVIDSARSRAWRICEHYDDRWNPQPDFNRDAPDHAFLPFGSTPGHGFEWARLIAQSTDLPGTEGFHDAAEALYRRAVVDGWHRLGSGGFVYTVDWSGSPCSTRELHWVAAEALAAASVLERVLGTASSVAGDADRWLDHIRNRFVDERHGSWTQEIGRAPAPKPDLYHAVQAMLIPQLPVAPSLLAAVQERRG